jgi:hypothetical protein
VARAPYAPADIGAYELEVFHISGMHVITATSAELNGTGKPGLGFQVMASQDLIQWNPEATGLVGSDGRFVAIVTFSQISQRFFRIQGL